MNNIRRLEAIFGVLTVLFGFLSLAFSLFGPVYRDSNGGTSSLVDNGLSSVTRIAFGILLLGLFGTGIGSILHSRTERKDWQILLWVSAVITGACMGVALLSVGIFFLPSVICACVAGALSLRRDSSVLKMENDPV